MHLTRRYFLKSTGAVVSYLGIAPLLPSLARAATPQQVTKNKVLVALFLRGGADGLNLVTPYGDEHYAELRRGIGAPAPDAGNPNALIDLDGFFGLNPRM